MSTFHMGISVPGLLRKDGRELRRLLPMFKHDDGTPYCSVQSLRDELIDELSKGHEVLPMSKECVGFDYKTGCPGHEVPDVAEAQP